MVNGSFVQREPSTFVRKTIIVHREEAEKFDFIQQLDTNTLFEIRDEFLASEVRAGSVHGTRGVRTPRLDNGDMSACKIDKTDLINTLINKLDSPTAVASTMADQMDLNGTGVISWQGFMDYLLDMTKQSLGEHNTNQVTLEIIPATQPNCLTRNETPNLAEFGHRADIKVVYPIPRYNILISIGEDNKIQVWSTIPRRYNDFSTGEDDLLERLDIKDIVNLKRFGLMYTMEDPRQEVEIGLDTDDLVEMTKRYDTIVQQTITKLYNSDNPLFSQQQKPRRLGVQYYRRLISQKSQPKPPASLKRTQSSGSISMKPSIPMQPRRPSTSRPDVTRHERPKLNEHIFDTTFNSKGLINNFKYLDHLGDKRVQLTKEDKDKMIERRNIWKKEGLINKTLSTRQGRRDVESFIRRANSARPARSRSSFNGSQAQLKLMDLTEEPKQEIISLAQVIDEEIEMGRLARTLGSGPKKMKRQKSTLMASENINVNNIGLGNNSRSYFTSVVYDPIDNLLFIGSISGEVYWYKFIPIMDTQQKKPVALGNFKYLLRTKFSSGCVHIAVIYRCSSYTETQRYIEECIRAGCTRDADGVENYNLPGYPNNPLFIPTDNNPFSYAMILVGILSNGDVEFWSIKDATRLKIIHKPHTCNEITAVIGSNKGDMDVFADHYTESSVLITGSLEGEILRWDMLTLTPVTNKKRIVWKESPITAFCCTYGGDNKDESSASSAQLIAGNLNGELAVWTLKGRSLTKGYNYKHPSQVEPPLATFSNNGGDEANINNLSQLDACSAIFRLTDTFILSIHGSKAVIWRFKTYSSEKIFDTNCRTHIAEANGSLSSKCIVCGYDPLLHVLFMTNELDDIFQQHILTNMIVPFVIEGVEENTLQINKTNIIIDQEATSHSLKEIVKDMRASYLIFDDIIHASNLEDEQMSRFKSSISLLNFIPKHTNAIVEVIQDVPLIIKPGVTSYMFTCYLYTIDKKFVLISWALCYEFNNSGNIISPVEIKLVNKMQLKYDTANNMSTLLNNTEPAKKTTITTVTNTRRKQMKAQLVNLLRVIKERLATENESTEPECTSASLINLKIKRYLAFKPQDCISAQSISVLICGNNLGEIFLFSCGSGTSNTLLCKIHVVYDILCYLASKDETNERSLTDYLPKLTECSFSFQINKITSAYKSASDTFENKVKRPENRIREPKNEWYVYELNGVIPANAANTLEEDIDTPFVAVQCMNFIVVYNVKAILDLYYYKDFEQKQKSKQENKPTTIGHPEAICYCGRFSTTALQYVPRDASCIVHETKNESLPDSLYEQLHSQVDKRAGVDPYLMRILHNGDVSLMSVNKSVVLDSFECSKDLCRCNSFNTFMSLNPFTVTVTTRCKVGLEWLVDTRYEIGAALTEWGQIWVYGMCRTSSEIKGLKFKLEPNKASSGYFSFTKIAMDYVIFNETEDDKIHTTERWIEPVLFIGDKGGYLHVVRLCTEGVTDPKKRLGASIFTFRLFTTSIENIQALANGVVCVTSNREISLFGVNPSINLNFAKAKEAKVEVVDEHIIQTSKQGIAAFLKRAASGETREEGRFVFKSTCKHFPNDLSVILNRPTTAKVKRSQSAPRGGVETINRARFISIEEMKQNIVNL